MNRPIIAAIVGALALGGAALLPQTASAMPAPDLSQVARNHTAGDAVQEVRYHHHPDFHHHRGPPRRRHFDHGRRFDHRHYGHRHHGSPVRRLLRHL